MKNPNVTFVLAFAWGCVNALEDALTGADAARIIVVFLGSAIVGTLITMAVGWIVLAIIGKKHLLITVTNWVLLIGICLGLLSALIAVS